jgi:sulfoxide reductase heme-binding subunit YedZ
MPKVANQEPQYRLLDNSRFYILVSSVLISGLVLGWLRQSIVSDQLFYIRAQQIFGLLCALYWYVALVISPIGYVIDKQHTRHLEFARRAIGVSACYFVLLHAGIAIWGQLGGLSQIGYLPSLFKWSLLAGAIALSILLVMASTSLDRVVTFMTLRRWKWLHRLVYVGGILAVLHIWTIGTHLAYVQVQVAAFVALVVLSGLELFRVTKLLNAKYLHLDVVEAGAVFLAFWIMAIGGLVAIPIVFKNYHSQHHDHAETTKQGTP